jgi:crotonobetainyl-CoA:carnitine CoA-transferase CaiB-like acyl-CoA transferase
MAELPRQLFSGVKVIAVARVIAAPFCTMHLAVNGADVITIENPDMGDSTRVSENDDSFLKPLMSRSYLPLNLNKRSLTLAINTPEGQAIFKQLVKDADVVVENLRTGTMERYGLGYEELSKINPGLVYCSVTGYGRTGPKKSDPGIDDAIQAGSGLMSITGTPETGPMKTGSTVVDYTTGYASAFAIASALFHKQRTGQGQQIDISMMEVAMTMMSGEVTRAVTGGEQPPLSGNASNRGRYVSNSFPCKEGHVSVAARSTVLRGRFFKAIGREDLPQDPRFATEALGRKNLKELEAEIRKTMLEKTADEWEAIFMRDGVPAMKIIPLVEAVKQPQVVAREFIKHFPAEPAIGLPAFGVPTPPYRHSRTPFQVSRRAPTLGEHTNEVLASIGLSKDEIAKLREKKVV